MQTIANAPQFPSNQHPPYIQASLPTIANATQFPTTHHPSTTNKDRKHGIPTSYHHKCIAIPNNTPPIHHNLQSPKCKGNHRLNPQMHPNFKQPKFHPLEIKITNMKTPLPTPHRKCITFPKNSTFTHYKLRSQAFKPHSLPLMHHNLHQLNNIPRRHPNSNQTNKEATNPTPKVRKKPQFQHHQTPSTADNNSRSDNSKRE